MTADYIYSYDRAYNLLVSYFLPELSKTEFSPDAAAGDERFPVFRYLAALLPYKPNYTEITKRIQSTQKECGDV